MIGATYLVKGYVNARRWNMKLKSITLQNFRGIEKLTIVLDEKTFCCLQSYDFLAK